MARETPKPPVSFALRVRPDVCLEHVSDEIEDLLGISAAQALADPAGVLGSLDDADRARVIPLLESAEAGQVSCVDLQWRNSRGQAVFTRCAMKARARGDGSVLLEGTVTDVTDLRRGLDVRAERLRMLAESCCEVVWTQSSDGTIAYICDAVERTRGLTRDEALRQSISQMHPPESAARLAAYIESLFTAIKDEAGTLPAFDGEQEYYRADGSIMVGQLTILPHVDADGNFVEVLGIVRDISDRKVREAELKRQASVDALTGLSNRRCAEAELADEVHNHLTDDRPRTLLIVDVDHFKTINDTAGHLAGDGLLAEVARLITANTRASDLVARWGGDEFVVLLRDCGLRDALNVAEKLRISVRDRRFTVGGRVSVSVGVAQLAAGDDTASWLAQADGLLYRAKESGRNRVFPADVATPESGASG